MKLSRLKLAALLSTAAVFSCSDPICGCSPALPYAYISGQVTDAEGIPVAGAIVRARVGNATCDAPYRSLEVYPAQTGATGTYRSTLLGHGATGTRECMQAWAEAPAGAAALESEPVQFAVRFNSVSESPDSVRVDLQLRAIEQEMTLWVDKR